MPRFGSGGIKDGTHVNTETDAKKAASDEIESFDVRALIDSVSQPANKNAILGAPPPVLYLSAYSRLGGSSGAGSIGHLKNIPVVITQFSIPYPTDCDYIPTAEKEPTPMPTVMTLDIQLTESHAPVEYANFSLDDFKKGNLTGF